MENGDNGERVIIGMILGISSVGSAKFMSVVTGGQDVLIQTLDCPSEEWVKRHKGHWVQVVIVKGVKPGITLLPPPLWRVEKLPTGHDKLWCSYCDILIGTRHSTHETEEDAKKLLLNLRSHMSEDHPEKAPETV